MVVAKNTNNAVEKTYTNKLNIKGETMLAIEEIKTNLSKMYTQITELGRSL